MAPTTRSQARSQNQCEATPAATTQRQPTAQPRRGPSGLSVARRNAHPNLARTIINSIKELDVKFRKACHQVTILNDKIISAKQRYERARREGRKSFRYFLRINMANYEGVRNMYYEYASIKCDEIENLQDQLVAYLAANPGYNS